MGTFILIELLIEIIIPRNSQMDNVHLNIEEVLVIIKYLS